MNWKNIKLLIVDLDNTLADTFRTLSVPQWGKVIRSLQKNGFGACAIRLKKNFGAKSFVRTLKECKLTEEEMKHAVGVYDKVDVSKLKLYDDAHFILDLPIDKILISRGEPSLQKRKIQHLGIRKYFKEICIVDTFYTKDAAIAKILRGWKMKPDEVLIIGDRVEEEIRAGIKLGIPTVLVRRPGWSAAAEPKPTLTVRKLTTVAKKLTS